MENFKHDVALEHLSSLTTEERLQGLPTEKRLQGLPIKEIELYLEQIKANKSNSDKK